MFPKNYLSVSSLPDLLMYQGVVVCSLEQFNVLRKFHV